jgi:hypothetical protein
VGDDYRIKRNNNSPFVIAVYDLQVYVPVPVAGSEPVRVLHRGDLDVQVTWKDAADNDLTGSLGSFQAGEVYRADITISAINGWAFDPAINFEYPRGSVTNQPGPDGDLLVRALTTVTYRAAEAPKTVDQVDLSSYIPVPALKTTPAKSFGAAQYMGIMEWSDGVGSPDLFRGGVIYTATVTLAAAPGYVMSADPGFYHTGDNLDPDPAALAFTAAPGNSGGTLRIVFPPTRLGKDVDIPLDLTDLIPAPAAGAVPVSSFISPSMQFTGRVDWKDLSGEAMGDVFLYGKTYTAEVTLIPAPGFVFPGNWSGPTDFTHQYDDPGVPPVYVPGNGGPAVVTVSFPATPNRIPIADNHHYDLANYLPLPEAGENPVWAIDQWGLTGTVKWDYYTPQGYRGMSVLEVFHCEVYRAEISFRAKTGYEFVPTAFYYQSGTEWISDGDLSDTGSRIVTVVYKETPGSFSPGSAPGSALKRIRDAAGRNEYTSETAPLYVDLSRGEEKVSFSSGSLGGGGIVLNTQNSPHFIRINGRGRKIQLEGTRSENAVLTLMSGVTLYLRNITLAGMGNNNAPLIKVNGGTLVLEDGAVIENNTNTMHTGAGGIEVINNGTLRLAGSRAVIRNNTASNASAIPYHRSGGVYLADGGKLLLDAGEISGNLSACFGGGVYNKNGSLIMTGGKICQNTAGIPAVQGLGGGVYSYEGRFTMGGGEISGNTSDSGGGVYFYMSGPFIKTGGTIYGDTDTTHTPGGAENTAASGDGHAVNLYLGKVRNDDAPPALALYANQGSLLGPWNYDGTSDGVGDTTVDWQ